MKSVGYIFLFLALLTDVASGRGGNAKPPVNAYETKAQNEAYQASMDSTSAAYDNSTKAVNSKGYDDYLATLDSSYNKQVDNINGGGNGGLLAKDIPKYTPEKVASETSASGSTSTATGANGESTGPTTDPESYATVEEMLLKSFCPSTCGQIKNEQEQYACNSDCAQGAVASSRKPAENAPDAAMLAALLMASQSDQ